MKLKLSFRIWLLIIFVFFSILAIFGMPPSFFQKGVIITSVETNSTAFEQGLRQGQIITKIDGQTIKNIADFSAALQGKFTSGENIKLTIETKDLEAIIFSNHTPDITVSAIPKTNLKLGLDLSGGSRALVKAQNKELSGEEAQELVDVISNRLNVYGISDMKVLAVSDLAGNNFMLIELAGATPRDLKNLISEQGKFEAKIGEELVFVGGANQGIASVARSGQESGIYSCDKSSEQEFCNFRFTVYLTEEAAKKQAEATDKLGVNVTPQGNYLSEKLDLYLDDQLVDSLLISEGLKGVVTTQISISGSGSGATREEAYNNAEEQMKKLQTVLITGSLPFKLEIIKLDTISPTLGKQFTKSIFLAGFVAFLAVAIVVFLRYKKIKSSLLLLIVVASEITIILGVASLIEWNLDLPSIAGIIATIGTGVDSEIILLDEARQITLLSIKQKLKRAFAIVLGAYFTTLVSLLPLLWAGAGLLKGFAFTTIIGITIGVLITRPAFSDMIRKIEE